MCATNTGGLHSFYQETKHSTGGGVSGFCKALAQERPDALVKVVTFNHEEEPHWIASQLVAETLRDAGVIEVGTEDGQRFGITITEDSWEAQADNSIPEESVFLVTGGTGGIVPSVIQTLYSKTKGKFYLIGWTPLPSKDDVALDILKRDGAEGLKQHWMQAMLNGGQRSDSRSTPIQSG